jgi:hypothetical protein
LVTNLWLQGYQFQTLLFAALSTLEDPEKHQNRLLTNTQHLALYDSNRARGWLAPSFMLLD